MPPCGKFDGLDLHEMVDARLAANEDMMVEKLHSRERGRENGDDGGHEKQLLEHEIVVVESAQVCRWRILVLVVPAGFS